MTERVLWKVIQQELDSGVLTCPVEELVFFCRIQRKLSLRCPKLYGTSAYVVSHSYTESALNDSPVFYGLFYS